MQLGNMFESTFLSSAQTGRTETALDRIFLHRLKRLFLLLQPYTALYLVVLSLIDAYLGSKVGRMIGEFYRALLDQDRGLFTSCIFRAAAFYVLNSLSAATVAWLGELLGVHWRRQLTAHLHDLYLSHRRYVRILNPSYDGKYGAEAASPLVDNPDQRIAQDAALLCTELAQVAKTVAAAPLSLLYYAYLTYSYTGFTGVLVAFLFFLVGAAIQRPLVARVAEVVYQQERLEGDFRAHHVRVRTRAESIALMRAEEDERTECGGRLESVVRNLTRLVGRRWLLTLTTKYLEYSGAIINYLIIAIPLFSGAWDPKDGKGTGGEVAMKISQASFVTLSLVYGFTQLLDLATKITTIAGNLSRVYQLIEEMEALPPVSGAFDAGQATNLEVESLAGDAREVGSKEAGGPGSLPTGPLKRRNAKPVTTVLPPVIAVLNQSGEGPSANLVELSAHQISGPRLADLTKVFPDAPQGNPASDDNPASLTLLTTIQRSRVDLAPRPEGSDTRSVAAEMDRLLDQFLGLFNRISAALGSRGFWCDAVDPRTGQGLRSRAGERFGEAAWAQLTLSYPLLDNGICPMLCHPTFGTSCYPATLVTDAPAHQLAEAIDEAFGGSSADVKAWIRRQEGASGPSGGGAEFTAPLLSVRSLSVRCPTGQLASILSSDTTSTVAPSSSATAPVGVSPSTHGEMSSTGLTLDVWPGELVMLTGPNGLGKSTALKAVAGIYKRESGSVSYAVDSGDVVFLPQEAVLGPGASLRSQVEYGASGSGRRIDDDEVKQALRSVGLASLLDRCSGDLDAKIFGTQLAVPLSAGELQRLALARMLVRRPKLAILDEPLAAVSQEDLPGLFSVLRASGAGILTVCHGAHFEQLHDSTIRLKRC